MLIRPSNTTQGQPPCRFGALGRRAASATAAPTSQRPTAISESPAIRGRGAWRGGCLAVAWRPVSRPTGARVVSITTSIHLQAAWRRPVWLPLGFPEAVEDGVLCASSRPPVSHCSSDDCCRCCCDAPIRVSLNSRSSIVRTSRVRIVRVLNYRSRSRLRSNYDFRWFWGAGACYGGGRCGRSPGRHLWGGSEAAQAAPFGGSRAPAATDYDWGGQNWPNSDPLVPPCFRLRPP